MKTLHVYNGVYFAWAKTPVPTNTGSEIQSFVGMLNLESKFIKENPKRKQDRSDLRSWIPLYIQYKGR